MSMNVHTPTRASAGRTSATAPPDGDIAPSTPARDASRPGDPPLSPPPLVQNYLSNPPAGVFGGGCGHGNALRDGLLDPALLPYVTADAMRRRDDGEELDLEVAALTGSLATETASEIMRPRLVQKQAFRPIPSLRGFREDLSSGSAPLNPALLSHVAGPATYEIDPAPATPPRGRRATAHASAFLPLLRCRANNAAVARAAEARDLEAFLRRVHVSHPPRGMPPRRLALSPRRRRHRPAGRPELPTLLALEDFDSRPRVPLTPKNKRHRESE